MLLYTFHEFLINWELKILPQKDQMIRRGQSLMNYLELIWPEESKRISSIHYYDESNIDCFYIDDLIPSTLKHLENVWNKFPN